MVWPTTIPRARPARFAGVLAVAVIALVFVICHPYAGIRGDATIYVMRALADLDPASLGRDLMVVEDGQMRFSLFPLLLRPLVAALGAVAAAMLVAALGSAAWLAALAALAQRLAPDRTGWAMVAMVAVLPVGYGYPGLFAFAETLATPRPLAEAAVMAALAALLAERRAAAAAALGLAALLHPIMALPGLGAAVLIVAARLPPRARLALAVAAALATIVVLALGVLGVPLLARLVARPDAAWLDLLHQHSPHLFPTQWPADTWTAPIAQAATIAVAAHRAPPRQRQLYLAVLAVGILGLVCAALLADEAHLLLVIQAQTWRALWLVGVVGGCALAFCTTALWGDARGRLILALLALAWLFQPTPALTLAVAGLALLLELGALGRRLPLADRHVAIVWLLVAACALYWAIGPWLGYLAFLKTLAPDESRTLVDPLRNNLHTLPLLVVIVTWLAAPTRVRGDRMVIALACACLVFGMLVGKIWDQRTPAQAYLETPHELPGLAALAAGRSRQVLWLEDESDAWFALGRPQYFSPQQGVAMVFSRPLAMEWARRANSLVALGLEPRGVFMPWRPALAEDRTTVTQAAVDTLCARPEAPGLLIMPRDKGAGLRAAIAWPLPAPLFRDDGGGRHRIDGFAILPCGAPGIAP